MGLHDGHRERMRQRLLKNGMNSFADHEVLEWLLFHSIPRGDTNPIAHVLINTFGSLAGVLEASYDELMKVEGVGQTTALFLSNYRSVYQRYLFDRQGNQKRTFHDLETIAEYVTVTFMNYQVEVLHAIFLTSTFQLIRNEMISSGTPTSVRMDMRKFIELCLSTKATFVVLAHNHPSGLLLPSAQDVQTTIAAAEQLHRLDVHLMDHLIIGVEKREFVSMASSPEHSYIFNLGK